MLIFLINKYMQILANVFAVIFELTVLFNFFLICLMLIDNFLITLRVYAFFGQIKIKVKSYEG